MQDERKKRWPPGSIPVAAVMISYNEAHNMEEVLENLKGWAQEVFLVDSYSTDETVDIALRHGVHVVQRRFRGFGDQWNFALENLPITAPWTMKMDPDERLSNEVKKSISELVSDESVDVIYLNIRLWFMKKPLPVSIRLVRIWRTGMFGFSDVGVNEHLSFSGNRSVTAAGWLEHLDSPNLHHWLDKQNHYTTFEAAMMYRGDDLAAQPRLFGSSLERRMWLKRIYWRLPFRHILMFLHCYLVQGAWRAGRVGYDWARLRAMVYRLVELKCREMEILGKSYAPPPRKTGKPHPGAVQADE